MTALSDSFGKLSEEVFQRLFPLLPPTELIPEIRLHGKDEEAILAYETETGEAINGDWKVPFNSMGLDHHAGNFIAGYFGGSCLARWLLDHPEVVRGKKVLDLGSGSGLVAIAAAKAGAAEVEALDANGFSKEVIKRNAAANSVDIGAYRWGIDDKNIGETIDAFDDIDVVTGADIFHMTDGLMENVILSFAKAGKTVYVASYCEETPMLDTVGEALDIPPELAKWLHKNEVSPFETFRKLEPLASSSQKSNKPML